MKNKILVSIISVILILCNSDCFSQSGWFQLNSGTTKELKSAYFVNELTGFSVGDSGIIIKTTNGGTSWAMQNSGTLSYLASVNFVPQSLGNTGYAVGYDKTILKTTNAGANWSSIPSGLPFGNFNSVYFTNTNAGYIAHGIMDLIGAILRTTNGGAVWSNTSVSSEPLYSIHFTDASTGYAVGGDFEYGGFIVKTTNSGLNWNVIYTTSGLTILRSISFAPQSPSVGYTAGYFGVIYKTTNYGANWTNLNIGLNGNLNSIYSSSVDTVYAAGSNGLIVKTINSGANWQSQNTGTSNNINCIYFVNSNTGYAVGENGLILKTTTGGIIGINLISNNIPSQYYLYQNYPNPFNPVTKIRFDIPSLVRRGAGVVVLKIYDMISRELATLVNEQLQPGTYEVDWDGSNYSSGVYCYKLKIDGYTDTKKMVLIK